jgi:hypothetical protein
MKLNLKKGLIKVYRFFIRLIMKIGKKKLKNLWMPLDLRRKLTKSLINGWIKINKGKVQLLFLSLYIINL